MATEETGRFPSSRVGRSYWWTTGWPPERPCGWRPKRYEVIAARLVVAVPVSAPETFEELETEVDEVVCASTPGLFAAVGHWYRDFHQTTDAEVRGYLAEAEAHLKPTPA